MLGLLAVIAAGVLAIVGLLLIDRDETAPDRADEPRASDTPREWPTFETAGALLDAAADAGIDVCPNPKTPRTASLATDLLSCGLYTERFVSARIYPDEDERALDVTTFQEAAGYDLQDGRVPSSVLIGPREGGRPPWLLAGPTDQLRAAADELGGGLLDLTVQDNVIAPAAEE